LKIEKLSTLSHPSCGILYLTNILIHLNVSTLFESDNLIGEKYCCLLYYSRDHLSLDLVERENKKKKLSSSTFEHLILEKINGCFDSSLKLKL